MATLSPENATSPWSIVMPYGNDTSALQSIAAPPWVGPPTIRGTSDILQSCIMTLLACIYTALHLNVPASSSLLDVIWAKFRWAVMTLFAPEFVLFMAVDQCKQAWRLRCKLREIRKFSDTEHPGEKFDIDTKYAFFVIMGGIHVRVDDIMSAADLNTGDESFDAKKSKAANRKTARLSAQGVIRLAERRHWIPIEASKIDDKNKSNYFQKFLVVTQVSWMVVQCITRNYYGLPISLLEIHTMVHVACALFLYLFWLKKPHDVQDPEVVNSSKFQGEIAAMVQQQYYSHWGYNLAIYPRCAHQHHAPPPGAVRWVDPKAVHTFKPGDITYDGLAMEARAGCPASLEVTPKFVERWDRIFKTFTYEQLTTRPNAPKRPPRLQKLMMPSGHVPIHDHEAQSDTPWPDDDDARPPLLHRLAEFKDYSLKAPRKMPFCESGRNLDIHLSVDTDFTNFWSGGVDGALIMLLMVLSAAYGAVHVYAWNWNFPTEMEHMAWKISCLVTIGLYPTYPVVAFILSLFQNCFSSSEKSQTRAQAALFFLFLTIYIAARVYIVGGAFANLRLVPIGVYKSPEWLELFPHF